ncbi:MAG: hypothetical protein Kow0090_03520 [Myxococcota bacterium]
MKIAFTHNLRLTESEEEAEFDTPQTVEAIAGALRRLGHTVELLEVSGPASRIVARLEALNPDIVFNTAEGKQGKYREAFYPGLFDQLGLPYTGSDAYVCTLTMDKWLTEMTVSAYGVPTPRSVYVDTIHNWKPPEFTYPLIVKPNFEGSSKGITLDSIVESPDGLVQKVAGLLVRYPAGVLVEEFIQGRDVVVPFIEKASPETRGILSPAEYWFDPQLVGERRYSIYDYTLKQTMPEAVKVKVPADLPKDVLNKLLEYSQIVYKALSIRDLGRIDYRLTPDGKIYFIEANALPSLEPGAAIYEAAALAGLSTTEALLEAIIKSAAERYGIQIASRARRKRQAYKVGLTYNLKRIAPKQPGDDDSEAEYDSRSTIDSIKNAIASYGHEVIEIEATSELPSLIPSMQLDLVFNIAEGIQGRNRESQVPAILELLDIPYTGSDSATLSITLDKVLAKKVVRQAGLPTPNFAVWKTSKERIPKGLSFPLIVKPVAEGSSKGVMEVNVVEEEESLRNLAQKLLERYKQPVLIEEYLVGREFTVGLLGEKRPKVLPPMEIIFNKPNSKFPVYTFEHKLAETEAIKYKVPAEIDSSLQRSLERVARGVFLALGCRDVARVDLRLDRRGKAHFIECNPLPGLTPGWSDMCMIASAAGMDYRTLIGEIMAPAIRRLKAREKAQQLVRIEV